MLGALGFVHDVVQFLPLSLSVQFSVEELGSGSLAGSVFVCQLLLLLYYTSPGNYIADANHPSDKMRTATATVLLAARLQGKRRNSSAWT